MKNLTKHLALTLIAVALSTGSLFAGEKSTKENKVTTSIYSSQELQQLLKLMEEPAENTVNEIEIFDAAFNSVWKGSSDAMPKKVKSMIAESDKIMEYDNTTYFQLR